MLKSFSAQCSGTPNYLSNPSDDPQKSNNYCPMQALPSIELVNKEGYIFKIYQ